MRKKHRSTPKNAFGDKLFVPDAPAVDFDLDAFDIGLPSLDDTEELDFGLFDYDRTDNNSDCRYIRPRPTRMPAVCVRYDNAEALARELKMTNLTRCDCMVSGSFIFGDFLEAFFTVNNIHTPQLTISTLSMSEANVDSLSLLMEGGYVDRLRLMVSDYFFGHERRTIIPYIYQELDKDERFDFGVARVHTKTCHFLTDGGKHMVMHGSANLRSSGNVEQVTIEDDKALFDFYENTYNVLFSYYNVINHKVLSRSSWEQFATRLTSDSTKQNKE